MHEPFHFCKLSTLNIKTLEGAPQKRSGYPSIISYLFCHQISYSRT